MMINPDIKDENRTMTEWLRIRRCLLWFLSILFRFDSIQWNDSVRCNYYEIVEPPSPPPPKKNAFAFVLYLKWRNQIASKVWIFVQIDVVIYSVKNATFAIRSFLVSFNNTKNKINLLVPYTIFRDLKFKFQYAATKDGIYAEKKEHFSSGSEHFKVTEVKQKIGGLSIT